MTETQSETRTETETETETKTMTDETTEPPTTTDSPEVLLTRLVDHVFALSGRFLAAGDEITRPEELSAARWLILGALRHGPSSPAEIARRRGLTRQAIRESVARLERSGHISRTEGSDRRTFLLELAPRGRAALDRIEPRRRRWAEQTAARVDAAQLEDAVALLARLRATFE